ncbi:MAG TPA: DUF6259 domain-containing protein [Armatimonadota bacterium]|jgi:hypothetical protein
MTLSTPGCEISISEQSGGIASIACPPGHLIFSTQSPTPLWRLTLGGPGGQRPLEAEPAALKQAVASQNGIALRWEWPAEGMAVRAVVRPEGDSIVWMFQVELPDGQTVVRADYPCIDGLRLPDGAKVAVPPGWGLEYDAAAGMEYDGAYPSCQAGMAFMAAYADGQGLYLGAHDPEGHHKQLVAKAGQNGVSLCIGHWAAECDTHGGVYTLPYAMVTAGLSDGYREASIRYRDFALTAPWSQAGRLSQRSIPEWLLDTEMWLKPGETPWTEDDAECIAATQRNLQYCRAARDYFGVPIALHWYRWHQIPYDVMYPEYFPPKAGFLDGVAQAQADGFRVMPYINGRLCDPESPTWKAGGSEFAARDDNGEPYTEVYGSKVPLHAMCPSTPMWQNTVSALAKRIFEEVHTDGVYIDQIAAAYPVRCLDKRHPHSPGGGSFWTRSYRDLLDRVRAVMPPNTIVTSEENAEVFVDKLDGLLVLNAPTDGSRPIPMYPLVYSGRAVTFGFLYIPAPEKINSLAFKSKMARAFLWGSQPGWLDAGRVMAPDATEGAEMLRSVARTRRHARRFLVYGSLLGELTPGGDNPRLSAVSEGSFGGTYQLDIDAVIGAAWKSEDGALGVALANLDNVSHTVTVTLPLAEAGISGSFTLEAFGPEGSEGRAASAEAVQTVTLPARGALVLAVESTRQ